MEHHDEKRLLVILDLDETLIHATKNKLVDEPDFTFEECYVYRRPFLNEFLKQLHAKFRVAIWSSADDVYVNEVVKLITPDAVSYEFIWGRSRCSVRRNVYDEYVFEKRLDKVKGKYSLEQVVIIDDTPDKSRNNYGNAIHISEFTGNVNDTELVLLLNYLVTLEDVTNIRAVEKRGWRFNVKQ